MLANYYDYNHTHPVIEWFISRMNDRNYRYYASELLRRLMQSPDFDPDPSIRKAIAIMRLTGIPVQEHLTCIYRSTPKGIRRDWKLTDLACSLIIISYESSDDGIEEMQTALMDYLGV